MTLIDAGAHKPINDLPAASAAAAANLLRTSQSGTEGQLTLTQLITLVSADIGTAVADDITVSSMTISSLTAGLSAASYTLTGQTSAAAGTVLATSGWGFATKGQAEAFIALILNNETAIDELRS
jgi:hypothetical protein